MALAVFCFWADFIFYSCCSYTHKKYKEIAEDVFHIFPVFSHLCLFDFIAYVSIDICCNLHPFMGKSTLV